MRTWLLGFALLVPTAVSAQSERLPLSGVAEETRSLWERQDAPALLSGSPQVILQLPGADPSAPGPPPRSRSTSRG